MIASSSTFRPHPGRVIRDLFRQLHAIRHGTEALVYNNHPREAAASSVLAITFGLIGVPWDMGPLASVQALVKAVVALKGPLGMRHFQCCQF